MKWVKDNYNIDVGNDNLSDAIGIAHFIYVTMMDDEEI